MTYNCAGCGGRFESDWSEAEAAAEYEAKFSPAERDANPMIVCDVCYKAMLAREQAEAFSVLNQLISRWNAANADK